MTVDKKYTAENAKQISEIILNQLTHSRTGMAVLHAMVGASNFTYSQDGSTTFHFKLCRRANMVKITLNDMDLYDLTLYRFNKKSLELKEVEHETNLYGEDLQGVFTSFTGLDTHL